METINNCRNEIEYDLPLNGRCPVCRKKLKIVEKRKTIYKGMPIWIHHDVLIVEVRCQYCDIIYIDKKIA